MTRQPFARFEAILKQFRQEFLFIRQCRQTVANITGWQDANFAPQSPRRATIIGNCHNGTLVDPLDTRGMATALLALLSDPDKWRTASQNGLKNIPRHYSWEAHAETYLSRLFQVVGKRQLLPKAPRTQRPMQKHHRAIFTDLDKTLLGDSESLKRFVDILRTNRKTTTFGINTSRSRDAALSILKEHGIPLPDILITSLGTEIWYAPSLTPSSNWQNHIENRWAPNEVSRVMADFPQLSLRDAPHQGRFKLSWEITGDDVDTATLVREINSRLRQEDQNVNVLLSFDKYLDIIPHRASKGMALRYVANLWSLPLENVLVAAGSGSARCEGECESSGSGRDDGRAAHGGHRLENIDHRVDITLTHRTDWTRRTA